MFAAESLINQLRVVIENQFENSREKSLAITKLDECMLWLSQAQRKSTSIPTDEPV